VENTNVNIFFYQSSCSKFCARAIITFILLLVASTALDAASISNENEPVEYKHISVKSSDNDVIHICSDATMYGTFYIAESKNKDTDNGIIVTNDAIIYGGKETYAFEEKSTPKIRKKQLQKNHSISLKTKNRSKKELEGNGEKKNTLFWKNKPIDQKFTSFCNNNHIAVTPSVQYFKQICLSIFSIFFIGQFLYKTVLFLLGNIFPQFLYNISLYCNYLLID